MHLSLGGSTTSPIIHAFFFLSGLPSTLATLVIYGHSSSIPSILTLPRDQTCPKVADGLTSTSFPWTHAPTCVDAFPSEDATTKSTYCVYTSARFAGNRGISFITTPEVATAYLLESFSHEDQGNQGDEMWEVKEAGKGKGKGVFIKDGGRRIEEGEGVIVKHPVLIISKEVLHPQAREERHRLLELAVGQLPEQTRDRVMKLAISWGGDVLDDVVQTNAMDIGVLGGVEHLALLPETARINHACRPNTFYRFDDYTLTVGLFSVRNIVPGEEVTYSYGFSEQPFDTRNDALFTKRNFRCLCPLCSAPSASVFISDQRLADIASIKSSLPTGFENIPQFIAILPNLIKLLEEEGLVIEKPMYEEILAYSWSALGIEERARYWAERARRSWEIVAGKDSREVRRVGELERDVKGHGTWMTWDKDPWDDSVWEDDDHHHHQEHAHEY